VICVWLRNFQNALHNLARVRVRFRCGICKLCMHNLETAHTRNMCRFKDTRLDLFGSNLLETVCDKVGQPGCWIVGLVTRAFYHRS